MSINYGLSNKKCPTKFFESEENIVRRIKNKSEIKCDFTSIFEMFYKFNLIITFVLIHFELTVLKLLRYRDFTFVEFVLLPFLSVNIQYRWSYMVFRGNTRLCRIHKYAKSFIQRSIPRSAVYNNRTRPSCQKIHFA